ncbi:EXS family-domain-containing protein [Podospora fimiseda]|uniref:EXS family-domain-containing protein n=1 Tax=Podospora fimiseda TaxID=252190 RepID=A0AAN7BKN0_9PEZI|nr:EXS family-domain-containing protein [Podospora fimiseda]
MKFAKELEQNAVPEWRVKYLNYKAGKKSIKAVSRAINRATVTPTLTRRSSEQQQPLQTPQQHYTTPSSFFGLAQNFTPPRRKNDSLASNNLDPLETKVAGGKSGGDVTSALTRSPESGIRYDSFGGVPPSRASDRNFELPAPAMKVPSRVEDASQKLNRLALHRSASMANVPTNRSQSSFELPAGGMDTTPRQRVSRLFTTGSAVTRQVTNKSETNIDNFDSVRAAERNFFNFLDKELDKIETFYKQKEDQATERLFTLRAQLHEMRNRRTAEIADAKRKREVSRNRSSSDDEAGNRKQDGSRDWIAPLKGKFIKPGPNSKALQKMTRTPVLHSQNVDDGRDYVRRPPGDDVPYRSAKRKLKIALQEFYRGLELLKSYALLNRTAFRKLNKKYDKAVKARPPYRYMNEKVNKSWFVNSDVLDGHISTVEDLYARYFERGNHKIAAGKLRNLNKPHGDSSDSAFRSGLMIGLGGVFSIQGLIYGSELLFDPDERVQQETSYLMQLYGGYFLMLFLFILFTLDCRMWTKNKVNYTFIFEFDSRNFLDWKQVAEFPSFFFALFGVFLWLNFSRLGDWEGLYLWYPVFLIGITLVIIFFPAPILHYKARRWFAYSHYRLLLSGLYPVEFRDFFLGDIWCSLTYATCNIELFFCLYANSWNNPQQCNSSNSRLLGFFGALPPIWRALQCIRRYYDTGNVFPHLANCGKYGMTILTAVFLSMYRISNTETNMSLFIAFATINAVYCSIWDLFMDFSLLQANPSKKLLREITAIQPVSTYYIIMVVDPILRFSWIFYAIFTHDTQHSTIVSFMVAFAEVFRRGIWALLRVENEHCGNVAQYKASRDTPLPYSIQPSRSASSERLSLGGAEQRPSVVTFGGAASGADAMTPGSYRLRPTMTNRSNSEGIMPVAPTVEPSAVEEGNAQAPPVTPSGGAGGNTASSFRRRYSETVNKKSILQAMAEAHKQDFEKKRVPTDGGGGHTRSASGGGGLLSSAVHVDEDDEDDEADDDLAGLRSDEEDEDDESGSMEHERMHVREAERLAERGRDEAGALE